LAGEAEEPLLKPENWTTSRITGGNACMPNLTRRSTLGLLAAAATLPSVKASAQTKLKWAHVYEAFEPYHKWAVWAGEEFEKMTNGTYEIEVFLASFVGKESDINQGLSPGMVRAVSATGTWPGP
jgi:TRAP-type C4-dicarboxylate transport system substrate-binding protein